MYIYCLFELFEEVRRPEVLRDGVVHTGNHFVYGFFPRLFSVLAVLDGHEKFAQRLLDHVFEIARCL